MSDYESLLVDYFELVDARVRVDPEEIVRSNPEHASRLRAFFDNMGALTQLLDRLSADGGGARPPVPAAPPRTLGDFRIDREIGRGGMCVVYEAEQISIRRPVALKVLHAGAALDRERLARFQNEVHAVARLNHEHIVPVYTIGEHEGTHYFAMKLIDGATLTDVINAYVTQCPGDPDPPASDDTQGSKLSASWSHPSSASGLGASRQYFRQAVELMATVANAIDHAHQLGIVHRDIKPSNLLLDRDGKV